MLKKFLEWIGVKEKLHVAEHKPPFFREFDYRRLKEKMGEAGKMEIEQIRDAYSKLYGIK